MTIYIISAYMYIHITIVYIYIHIKCIYLKERGYDVIAVGHRKDDNGFFALHDMKYYSVNICNKDDFNKRYNGCVW